MSSYGYSSAGISQYRSTTGRPSSTRRTSTSHTSYQPSSGRTSNYPSSSSFEASLRSSHAPLRRDSYGHGSSGVGNSSTRRRDSTARPARTNTYSGIRHAPPTRTTRRAPQSTRRTSTSTRRPHTSSEDPIHPEMRSLLNTCGRYDLPGAELHPNSTMRAGYGHWTSSSSTTRAPSTTAPRRESIDPEVRTLLGNCGWYDIPGRDASPPRSSRPSASTARPTYGRNQTSAGTDRVDPEIRNLLNTCGRYDLPGYENPYYR